MKNSTNLAGVDILLERTAEIHHSVATTIFLLHFSPVCRFEKTFFSCKNAIKCDYQI